MIFLNVSNKIIVSYLNKVLVAMEYIFERITVDDELCNGKPTIRGMRITVQTVLEFLFNDTTVEEILEQYPVLEEDINACKRLRG